MSTGKTDLTFAAAESNLLPLAGRGPPPLLLASYIM